MSSKSNSTFAFSRTYRRTSSLLYLSVLGVVGVCVPSAWPVMYTNRVRGPYGWAFALLLLCNRVAPQFLWLKRVRTSVVGLFVVAMFVNVGMWLERFVIVVTSLSRDFLPSSWGSYTPTFWDFATFFGTIGLFLTLFFLFIRVLPAISIFEMRTLVPGSRVDEKEAA